MLFMLNLVKGFFEIRFSMKSPFRGQAASFKIILGFFSVMMVQVPWPDPKTFGQPLHDNNPKKTDNRILSKMVCKDISPNHTC